MRSYAASSRVPLSRRCQCHSVYWSAKGSACSSKLGARLGRKPLPGPLSAIQPSQPGDPSSQSSSSNPSLSTPGPSPSTAKPHPRSATLRRLLPPPESLTLLSATWGLMRSCFWPVLLIYATKDAMAFLLHRLGHRLTNLVAEVVLGIPLSAKINPWWLYLESHFLEGNIGYQGVIALVFFVCLPLNILLNSYALSATMQVLINKAKQPSQQRWQQQPQQPQQLAQQQHGTVDQKGSLGNVVHSTTAHSPDQGTPAAMTLGPSGEVAIFVSMVAEVTEASKRVAEAEAWQRMGPGTSGAAAAAPPSQRNTATSMSMAPSSENGKPPVRGHTASGSGVYSGRAGPAANSLSPGSPAPTDQVARGAGQAGGGQGGTGLTGHGGAPTGQTWLEQAGSFMRLRSAPGTGAAAGPPSASGGPTATSTSVMASPSAATNGRGQAAGAASAGFAPSSSSSPSSGGAASASSPATTEAQASAQAPRPGMMQRLRTAWQDVVTVLPQVHAMLYRVWQVDLRFNLQALPLQALSLLVVPLFWTLPRLLAIQLAVPCAIVEGAQGSAALNRSAQLMQGFRRAYAWPFTALIVGIRLLDMARTLLLTLVPPRWWSEVIELPVALILAFGFVKIVVIRMQDIMPAAAYLSRTTASQKAPDDAEPAEALPLLPQTPSL